MNPINLYPVPLWLTPQIPATTFNALSYEEMLRQFVYKLNEVIKYCNDVQKFSEEVKKLLEEFNKHVYEITLAELQRMYEDGTLQEILALVSADYFLYYKRMLDSLVSDSYLAYNTESENISLALIYTEENEND